MSAEFYFGVEVFLNGLMAGVMYSLVALGFVLIFKASGIFNYAQGVMALFAALTLVGFQNGQIPFAHLINAIFGTELHHFGWHMPAFLAIACTLLVMIAFAYIVEFLILDVGIPQGGNFWLEENTAFLGGDNFYGFYLDNLDIVAAILAVFLVSGLVAFSQYTKTGRALRAVADDHQAALSVGISLRTIWVIVWSIAGFVALIAGIMWGTKSGVQFSLSLIALKALPVLMLGGFTSIPGAIIGGLLIGVGEKMFEFLIGAPYLGGATENWFAYMLALLFLVFRPQGLFGEKIIERV